MSTFLNIGKKLTIPHSLAHSPFTGQLPAPWPATRIGPNIATARKTAATTSTMEVFILNDKIDYFKIFLSGDH
jgi:hypothetical protein